MSKNNNFVKSFKKIYLLINRLLEKYLNKLNPDNLSNIFRSNKVFLGLVTIIILFLSYLSIPHVYNKVEIRKELENQLLDKFGLNFTFPSNFEYNFYPRPHFIIEESYILEKQLNISDIKKLSIYVSLNNLFSLKNITIKDVILENTNFNFNKKNPNFFLKLLENNYLESTLIIKNSNIFFKSMEDEVLFVNKIKNMKYYYDSKELKNLVSTENEIFNIPYTLTSNKDQKKILSKIKFNFLNLQIENEIDYKNEKKKGTINLIYGKKKSKGTYQLDKNLFTFNYFDNLNSPKFYYEGKINLRPFFSYINGNTNKLDLSILFKPNLLLPQLVKTELLNHKNLNFDFNINAKQIKQYPSFINFSLNSKIKEGLIDIDKTKFSWNNYADFKITDSLLYVHQNQLTLDGKLLVKVKNYNEIYKFLQISKSLRPQLNTLEFNFNYNFDQQMISFNTIKVNGKISNKVHHVLKKIILKDNKLQNKIYFKNIMKESIAAYVG